VLVRPLTPNRARIDACLARAGVTKLDAVLPVHTHYDHAQDSAVVATITDAALIGGESTLNIGRGGGVIDDRLIAAGSVSIGAYDITHIASEHCPPDRFPGTIDTPLRPPARVTAYRCGEAWSITVTHRASGRRLLVQGSAGFVAGALAGQRAEVVYLGVGQLGLRPEAEIRQYWDETVVGVGARRAVLIHWDNFFRPLDQPLQAVSYAADNLDETMRIFDELAARDGVEVLFPTVWQQEDPWA
jgi:L-ascorbate metabolism protein UlaG (beta-lactamase superfamily)